MIHCAPIGLAGASMARQAAIEGKPAIEALFAAFDKVLREAGFLAERSSFAVGGKRSQWVDGSSTPPSWLPQSRATSVTRSRRSKNAPPRPMAQNRKCAPVSNTSLAGKRERWLRRAEPSVSPEQKPRSVWPIYLRQYAPDGVVGGQGHCDGVRRRKLRPDYVSVPTLREPAITPNTRQRRVLEGAIAYPPASAGFSHALQEFSVEQIIYKKTPTPGFRRGRFAD